VRQLGRGQYGTAHLVRRDGEEAVAKVVFLEHLKDRDRALALQEVEVLRRLYHPNVVRHFASWLHRDPSQPSQEALVNVMEFCAGGDLRHWLEACSRSGERLSEPLVLGLFAQMVSGIRYVHGQKVLHRDIKTSNMLLTEDRRAVKIGDFGIARVLETTAAVALTMLGTPYYMSPEVCKGEPYRQKSDMWSLGCVLYEMCALRHAFESQSLLGLVYCIVSESYDPIPDGLYSSAVTELVARLLVKPADGRPNADEALAAEPLRRLCGADGEPLELALPEPALVAPAVPPPPPPQTRSQPCAAPEPPPSPRSMGSIPQPPAHARQKLSGSPARRVAPFVGMDRPPPPPPQTLPKRPALLTGAGRWMDSPTKPMAPDREFGGPLSGPSGTERCVSPVRGLAGGAAVPSRQTVRSMPWAEAGYETRALLARVRNTLLRRPRALGNWVQAFAHHDTTGQGMLAANEFAAFLESLSVGLSRREAFMVTECLVGSNGMVSLGCFSDALTHASFTDPRFGEDWALESASALAGSRGASPALSAGASSRCSATSRRS